MFVATCDTCGRQARVDPAEILTHPSTHSRMRVAALAIHLRCRDYRTAPRGSTPLPACARTRVSPG